MAVLNANYAHFLLNTTFDKKTNIFRDLVYVQLAQYEIFLLLMKFYTIKFADLVGALMYCSINEAVAGCFCSRATSVGVFPYLSFTFGSAPASMRALMISAGAPFSAVQCNAFHLFCYSIVYSVSFVINQCLSFN
jgi:hypothetical protein